MKDFRPLRHTILATRSRPLQTFHNREDEHGREQTEHNEHAPNHPERHTCAPDAGDDAGEVVANGGHAEPQAHHHALVLWRCHLRDKGDANGTQQQFGKGQHEIGADQPVGRNQSATHTTLGLQLGRTSQGEGTDDQDEEAEGGYNHAHADLTRRGRLLAFLRQGAEDRHRDRR